MEKNSANKKFLIMKQDFTISSQNKESENQKKLNKNDNVSLLKSTDFNSKEIDEREGSPIKIKNLQSNTSINNLVTSNSCQSLNLESSNKTTPTVTTKSNSPQQVVTNKPIFKFNQDKDCQFVKNTIHTKISYISKLNIFIQLYVNDINNLYNKIDTIIYKKITTILDKHKYFQRFFKEITALYETFSINLLQANNTISLHFKDEDDINYSYINNTIDKSQELISNSFYDFSKNLQNKIIIKGPLSNIKDFYNKLSEISKESIGFMTQITTKKEKILQKYYKYEKIFENFKKCYNDNDKLDALLGKYEFFIIEFEFLNSANKLFLKINQFLNKHKQFLADLKELTNNFLNCIKETIDIYTEDSKKMFLIEDMDNKLESLKIQINGFEEVKDILMSSNTNKMINDHLQIFQTNMQKFPFIKKDMIYENEHFMIEKYKSYEELNEFIISILPENFDTISSSLLLYSCQVKKIYGIFKNSKNCVIAFTIQNSILLFEDKINKKNYEKLNSYNLKFRNLQDKNHQFRFEISEIKYGMIYNSTSKIVLDAESIDNYTLIENYFKK